MIIGSLPGLANFSGNYASIPHYDTSVHDERLSFVPDLIESIDNERKPDGRLTEESREYLRQFVLEEEKKVLQEVDPFLYEILFRQRPLAVVKFLFDSREAGGRFFDIENIQKIAKEYFTLTGNEKRTFFNIDGLAFVVEKTLSPSENEISIQPLVDKKAMTGRNIMTVSQTAVHLYRKPVDSGIDVKSPFYSIRPLAQLAAFV